MSDTLFFAIGALVLLAVFFLWFVWWKSKKRGLTPAQQREIKKHWEAVAALADTNRRVLEADKVLDHALGLLGFTGSMADKLRAAGPRFSHLQAIWDAHKLRNTIAHDVGVSVSERDAARAVDTFEKAVNDLC